MITMAMVGTGNWGKNLVRNFAQLPSAHLKYCVDQSEERLAKLSPLYPDTEFTTDFDKVLADPDIDAVGIAASAPAHHPLGMRALAAGKHTYIEKPLALTTAQATELVTESETRGLTLMVGHLLLYHAAGSAFGSVQHKMQPSCWRVTSVQGELEILPAQRLSRHIC